MISLQTNVDSLIAQNNLNINNELQSNTIDQLTSGYRINKAGDDAAGLAIANEYQSTISQLTQGVNNANDGVSQLQIIDGGLSNIETILNRMQTLATESASGTFTGDRSTLNQEYQQLVSEISRQASNINLNAGGSFNSNLSVFIGGANTTANAQVNINLAGSSNAVDATSLGLANTTVAGGGTGFGTNNTQLMNTPGQMFLAHAGTTTQTLTFNVINNGTASTIQAVVSNNGNSAGITADQALSQLNNQLNAYGITAGVDSNGYLQFSGGTPFTVSTAAATNGTGIVTGSLNASNSSNYVLDSGAAFAALASGDTETLTFQTSSGTATVNLDDTSTTATQAINAINAVTAKYGIYAVASSATTNGISFQSASNFSVEDSLTEAAGGAGPAEGVFGNTAVAGATTPFFESSPSTPSATGSVTGNAEAAMTAIQNAIAQIGTVQGVIGAGENTLNYAINLANSQIENLSTAESSIKDADVAQAAANLTKSQVLVQTSIAALAQANAEPQAVLKLLQG